MLTVIAAHFIMLSITLASITSPAKVLIILNMTLAQLLYCPQRVIRYSILIAKGCIFQTHVKMDSSYPAAIN